MIVFRITSPINRSQQDIFDAIVVTANNLQHRKGDQAAEWMSDAPLGTGSRMYNMNLPKGRKAQGCVQLLESLFNK